MEFLIAMLVALCGAIGAILAPLIAEQSKASAPEIAFWLTRRATRLLPNDLRTSYEEEWLAVVANTAGPLLKLKTAIGFRFAIAKIVGDHPAEQQQSVTSESETGTSSPEPPTVDAYQPGFSSPSDHKLSLGDAVTFHSHLARRLDYIHKDLVSPACRQQPISLIAFRWGFNDLSSFNRAFKNRYGYTPSQFRGRAGR